MSQPVGPSVEGERQFAVRLVGNDSRCAALLQPVPQRCAVVSLVTKQLLGRLGTTDQTLGGRTIVRLAASQENGKKTAFSIRECVDLRVAPAARAANRLSLLPPFPPEAERCALM
jgi:hypothetical protein